MQHAKVPVSDLTGVSETLLIPLIARAQARTAFRTSASPTPPPSAS